MSFDNKEDDKKVNKFKINHNIKTGYQVKTLAITKDRL